VFIASPLMTQKVTFLHVYLIFGAVLAILKYGKNTEQRKVIDSLVIKMQQNYESAKNEPKNQVGAKKTPAKINVFSKMDLHMQEMEGYHQNKRSMAQISLNL
jgi:hypothetical protein